MLTTIILIIAIYFGYKLFIKPVAIAKRRINNAENMRFVRANVIEPSLKGKTPLDFFNELKIPLRIPSKGISDNYASSIAHHIFNFISHNDSMLGLFLKATSTGENPCDIARRERLTNLGIMHYLAYEAIINVAMKNGLMCFENIDIEEMDRIQKRINF